MSVSVKVLKALREIASWEHNRFQMRGIKLEPTGEMVATDGKILAWSQRTENGSPLGDTILARESIDAILKLAPKDGMVDPDADRYTDVRNGIDLGLERVEGRYPDWRKAIPAPEMVPTISLALGVPILESMIAALKAIGAGTLRMEVPTAILKPESHGSVDCAVRFSAMGGRIDQPLEGIVMPVQINIQEYTNIQG